MNIKYILPVFAFAATSAWAQQDKLSSGIDKVNMDLNAKPGTDFYQYATGGWTAAHPLTPEYSRYAQFDALAENNRKQLRGLIEEMAAKLLAKDKNAAIAFLTNYTLSLIHISEPTRPY